jgi:hypothetical protein
MSNDKKRIKEINLSLVKKALTKEEISILTILLGKVDTYREKLKIKPKDKLKRKSDGFEVTYVGKADMGVAYIYVEEFEHAVYVEDFEKIMD